MLRIRALALGAALTWSAAFAAAPDCQTSFTFNAGGTSAIQSNRQTGCIFWTVSYNAQGFSALSLELEAAPDAGNVPGAWSAFGGTVTLGSNPMTVTTQTFSTFEGYYPWLRLSLSSTTGSGTVVGVLQGWRGQGYLPPGTNPGQHVIDTRGVVALSSMGDTQIIAATMGETIYLGHLSISGDDVVDVKLTYGTGTNCGTGTGDLTGVYYSIDALALDLGAYMPLPVPAGNALCVNLSGAANFGGVVMYGKE